MVSRTAYCQCRSTPVNTQRATDKASRADRGSQPESQVMPLSLEHLVPMWSQKALGPFPTPKGACACPWICGVSGPVSTVGLKQESWNPQSSLELSRPLTQGCQHPPKRPSSPKMDVQHRPLTWVGVEVPRAFLGTFLMHWMLKIQELSNQI